MAKSVPGPGLAKPRQLDPMLKMTTECTQAAKALMHSRKGDPTPLEGESATWSLALRAILRDDHGRWLMLRRSRRCRHFQGLWETPGGKPEPGESLDAALRREVLEETGLSITIKKVAGLTTFRMGELFIVTLFFFCSHAGAEVVLSHEHDAVQWIAPGDLNVDDTNPQVREMIGACKKGELP